jgi:hypothetical protein
MPHLYLDLNMPNLKNIEYREPNDQLSIQRFVDYIGVVGSLHNPTLLADGLFGANDEFCTNCSARVRFQLLSRELTMYL